MTRRSWSGCSRIRRPWSTLSTATGRPRSRGRRSAATPASCGRCSPTGARIPGSRIARTGARRCRSPRRPATTRPHAFCAPRSRATTGSPPATTGRPARRPGRWCARRSGPTRPSRGGRGHDGAGAGGPGRCRARGRSAADGHAGRRPLARGGDPQRPAHRRQPLRARAVAAARGAAQQARPRPPPGPPGGRDRADPLRPRRWRPRRCDGRGRAPCRARPADRDVAAGDDRRGAGARQHGAAARPDRGAVGGAVGLGAQHAGGRGAGARARGHPARRSAADQLRPAAGHARRRPADAARHRREPDLRPHRDGRRRRAHPAGVRCRERGDGEGALRERAHADEHAAHHGEHRHRPVGLQRRGVPRRPDERPADLDRPAGDGQPDQPRVDHHVHPREHARRQPRGRGGRRRLHRSPGRVRARAGGGQARQRRPLRGRPAADARDGRRGLRLSGRHVHAGRARAARGRRRAPAAAPAGWRAGRQPQAAGDRGGLRGLEGGVDDRAEPARALRPQLPHAGRGLAAVRRRPRAMLEGRGRRRTRRRPGITCRRPVVT